MVKVWVHRVTPESQTESLPATARARGGAPEEAVNLTLSRGEGAFPLGDVGLEVEVALREFGGAPTPGSN